MTDGMDNNNDGTIITANKIKEEINRLEIQSKFCVLGFGSGHDA
jgi:hypothetical protein